MPTRPGTPPSTKPPSKNGSKPRGFAETNEGAKGFVKRPKAPVPKRGRNRQPSRGKPFKAH